MLSTPLFNSMFRCTISFTQFIELYLDGSLDELDAIGSKETEKRLDSLEQKVEEITARMKQFTEAIMQIQNYLNNQPRRQNKSYNNSYYQQSTPRIQPLTEEGLAARLGVDVEAVREQRNKLHPPLFVAWCKGKDRAGLGWEFNQNTGLYHAVT